MLTVKNYGENEYQFVPGTTYSGFVSEWSEVEQAGILSTYFDGAITEKVFFVFHKSYLVDKATPPGRGDIVSFHFPSNDAYGENSIQHTVKDVTVTKRRS